MTDEQQVRALLRRAADESACGQPPVDAVLERARRRRRARRVTVSALTIAAVAVGGVALPSLVRTLGSGRARPAVTNPLGLAPDQTEPGPTAAELARFRWSDLPASPLGPRTQPILAWTGKELLELGGLKDGSTTYDGAAFDPADGRWHRIATMHANVGLWHAVSVWTGRQLFVADGQFSSCLTVPGRSTHLAACLPRAGLYDPATNRWSTTLLPQAMYGLSLQAAEWTGSQVILAGVNANHGRLGIAAYDPATNRWQMITPKLPAGHPTRSIAMVTAPGRLILWSLWDRLRTTKDGFSDRAGIDVLAMGADPTWHDVTGDWPQEQNISTPALAGQEILISPGQTWCGTRCSPPPPGSPGYFADPATLTRTTIPPGPLGQTTPAFIWTGRTIIAINLDASITGPGSRRIRPDDLALYDPASTRWRELPSPPRSPPLSTTPIWAGSELLALTDHGALLTFHR